MGIYLSPLQQIKQFNGIEGFIFTDNAGNTRLIPSSANGIGALQPGVVNFSAGQYRWTDTKNLITWENKTVYYHGSAIYTDVENIVMACLKGHILLCLIAASLTLSSTLKYRFRDIATNTALSFGSIMQTGRFEQSFIAANADATEAAAIIILPSNLSVYDTDRVTTLQMSNIDFDALNVSMASSKSYSSTVSQTTTTEYYSGVIGEDYYEITVNTVSKFKCELRAHSQIIPEKHSCG